MKKYFILWYIKLQGGLIHISSWLNMLYQCTIKYFLIPGRYYYIYYIQYIIYYHIIYSAEFIVESLFLLLNALTQLLNNLKASLNGKVLFFFIIFSINAFIISMLQIQFIASLLSQLNIKYNLVFNHIFIFITNSWSCLLTNNQIVRICMPEY